MPMPRFALKPVSCALALGLLLLAACGQTPTTTPDTVTDNDALDTAFGFEAKVQDVPVVEEDLGPKPDIAPDVLVDTGTATDVLAVAAQTAPSVKLGGTTLLKVVVDHKIGVDGAPKATEIVVFQVNGKPLALGAAIAASAKDQPPIAIWQTADAGDYQIAGVRPGTAKLTVTVDGVASPEIALTTDWPDGLVLTGATATYAGSAPAKRVDEVAPDTVKVLGHLFAPGGVDATVRFPASAVSGDSFELGKAPAKGSLSIGLTIVSPAGLNQPATPIAGRLWLDQTDKGYFKGTFLGRTLDQTPIVGAFVIERDGNYGIDVLDEPTLVETSSLVTPESDLHASRVSVNAIGNGKALLTWRRIKNVTQSEIAMWIIDAKTGQTVTTLPALVQGNVGPKGQPNPAIDPVFGWVTAAVSNKKTLLVWEGKNGKDGFSVPAPTGVWMRGLEADGSLTNTGTFAANLPIAVGDDACNGTCSPQIVTLPNARFLVIWSPTTGGIRARRVEGDFSFTDNNPLQLVNPPATTASATVLDSTMGLTWRDPTLGAFMRVFTINPTAIGSSNQEMTVGGVTADAPMPGIGIFGGGSPGFLAFALDGSPATNLKMRRVDFSGTPVVGEITVDSGIGSIRAMAGESPQVVVLQTQANPTDANPLRVRKFTTTSPIDGGSALGPIVNLGAKTTLPISPSICYVPEVDIYIAAWSGDFKSEGVYFQRFR